VKELPEVLFVCVHNAGLSQMAAGLLDRAAEGRVSVRSAGSAPAEEIHANVREAMAEVGIDLLREFPKPLTDEVVSTADVVVTMGCGDACPVYPGKRYLDWDLPDPAGRPLSEVRAIRAEIEARVRAFARRSRRPVSTHLTLEPTPRSTLTNPVKANPRPISRTRSRAQTGSVSRPRVRRVSRPRPRWRRSPPSSRPAVRRRPWSVRDKAPRTPTGRHRSTRRSLPCPSGRHPP
jgi:arsenate reductase